MASLRNLIRVWALLQGITPPNWLTVKVLTTIARNDIPMTWYRDKMQYIRCKEVCEGVQVLGGYFINSVGQAERQNEALRLAEDNRRNKVVQIELSAEDNRRNKVVQIELSAEEQAIIKELSKNDEQH